MARDPWSEFEEVAPAQPSGAPKPIIAVPDYRGRDDARDADKAVIDAAEEARKQAEWYATHLDDGTPIQAGFRRNAAGTGVEPIAGGPAGNAAGKATEAQTKAAQYLSRLMQADADFAAVPEGSRDARTGLGQWFHETLPSVENSFNSGSRQMADQAARNFIAASLRQESGAAISNDEFANQYRIYFPMPGDGPEVINQKAAARRQAIESFRIAAGPLADQAAATVQPISGAQGAQPEDGRQQPPVAGVNTPQMSGGLPTGTPIQFGMDGGANAAFDRDAALRARGIPGLDGEATITAFWNANRQNPNLTAEGAAQWYQSQGIPVPPLADLQKSVDDAIAGFQFGGVDLQAEEAAYRERLRAQNAGELLSPDNPLSTLGLAANALVGSLGDEATGVQNAVGAALQGENPIDAYRFGRDVVRQQAEDIRAANPNLSTAAELAGGVGSALVVPGAGWRSAMGAGAVQGFGAGEGLVDSLAGTVIGGGAGAVLGKAGDKVADALAARAAARAGQPLSEGAEVIQAADNLNTQFGTNIRPLPADVAGPGIRNATGGAAKLPLAAQPIVKAAENVSAEAQAARDAIARMAGNPAANMEASGEAALNGAAKFIERTKTKVDALYAKARRLGGEEPVDLATARQVLDDNIAELSQTPGGAKGLERLKALRAELDQPYPVQGVKNMRTNLRDDFLSDGLRGSDLERRVGQVVDAAEQDIVNSLNAAGKGDAALAYSEAAKAHAERVGLIDSVLQPIIGRAGEKSGEQVMTAIASATKQNNARLGKFLTALPAEDAATIRSTIISNLGKVPKGAQDAEGTAFSPATFLTHWNDLSPQAKATLFGGELRSALDDLARVAQGTKEAQRFANFSNTGSPVGLLGTGAVASGFMTAPISTTLFMASQFGGGKLLSSPGFARWLAKMPAAAERPQTLSAHISNLSRIAANDTAIAADIMGLRQALAQGLPQAPMKAAATPAPEENTRKEGGSR